MSQTPVPPTKGVQRLFGPNTVYTYGSNLFRWGNKRQRGGGVDFAPQLPQHCFWVCRCSPELNPDGGDGCRALKRTSIRDLLFSCWLFRDSFNPKMPLAQKASPALMPKRAIGFQVLTEIKISAFVFVSRRFSPELNPDGARRAGGRRGY